MNSNCEDLNYFPFLTQQRSPASSRSSMPIPCAESSSVRSGGQTTRRSLPKNLHGNYEGDFSMFTSRSNQATGSLIDQILEAGLDLRLDQHFEAPASEEHMDVEAEADADADADEIVDEEIRAKMAEVVKQKLSSSSSLPSPSPSALASPLSQQPPVPSMWQRYKGKVFSAAQYNKIDAVIGVVQQNSICCKMGGGIKFLWFMISSLLRLLMFHIVVPATSVGGEWSAARCRKVLRKGARRLLWCMTLAKCGDIQFFGLVMVLTPLVFLVAALGFLFVLYCVIKQGIHSIVRHTRFLASEVPQIED